MILSLILILNYIWKQTRSILVNETPLIIMNHDGGEGKINQQLICKNCCTDIQSKAVKKKSKLQKSDN